MIYAINGIWLFAGEGALYNASPSPQGQNKKFRDNKLPPYLFYMEYFIL
jgi:hypothetical protein